MPQKQENQPKRNKKIDLTNQIGINPYRTNVENRVSS